MLQNGLELSFVSDVKAKQCLDLIFIELREVVLNKSLEDFSKGRDGVDIKDSYVFTI